MKKLIKWLLSAVIGSVISIIIVLISESLHQLITCGLVAFVVFGILNYAVLEKSDMRLLISIASCIAVFLLYFSLYDYVNEECKLSNLLPYVVFFAPYVVMSYILFANPQQAGPSDGENTAY